MRALFPRGRRLVSNDGRTVRGAKNGAFANSRVWRSVETQSAPLIVALVRSARPQTRCATAKHETAVVMSCRLFPWTDAGRLHLSTQ